MDELELKYVLEALLMTHGDPLSIEKMQEAFTEHVLPSVEQIKMALSALAIDYESRAIELKCLAGGYVFQTKKRYSPWITRLLTEKPVKYSNAFLEVLAIIAYKQPVTRADIENIRGVAISSSMLKTLLEREWIRVAGYKDAPGKPALYATTKAFLDYFNLPSLDELPALHSTLQSELINE